MAEKAAITFNEGIAQRTLEAFNDKGWRAYDATRGVHLPEQFFRMLANPVEFMDIGRRYLILPTGNGEKGLPAALESIKRAKSEPIITYPFDCAVEIGDEGFRGIRGGTQRKFTMIGFVGKHVTLIGKHYEAVPYNLFLSILPTLTDARR